MTKPKILIVDDNVAVREALEDLFTNEYDVLVAESGQQALDTLSAVPEILTVILDIRMAKMDGFETTGRIRTLGSDIPIVFHTAFAGEYSGQQIEQEHHPYDLVGKNEHPLRLIRSVRNAVAYQQLRRNPETLIRTARSEYGLIGKSAAMQQVYRLISQVAPSESKVMIVGATGTGKELIARAIHRASGRAQNRFAVLNCNFRSPEMIDSELFGHVRGAFTGASADRTGLFEFADSGTIFLDEIADLDLVSQGKILRVLETGELSRVGSGEPIRVNVRVISAGHRHLSEAVQQGKFREDLYFRLCGITIEVPTLNDRREDIPDLVSFFLEEHAARHHQSTRILEKGALDVLLRHDWTGNVRQLRSVIHALVDSSPSFFVGVDRVQQFLGATPEQLSSKTSLRQQTMEFRRQAIISALHQCDGNISAAARILEMDRSNLRHLILDLNISL